jgi:alpha-beta hydrolase superfamily lysophospholipase
MDMLRGESELGAGRSTASSHRNVFPFRWLWRNRKLSATLVLSASIILLNLLAYLHSYAMTHYVPGGLKTPPPEQLSLFGKISVLVAGVQVPRPENRSTPDSVGLNYSTHRILAHDGSELEAWHIDCPKPHGLVLLFHGYAACRSSLLNDAKVFHELGYATLLVDFHGSGGSSGSVTTIGVREAVDVADVVGFAKRQLPDNPLVFFGHSMGAVAILRAVSVHAVEPAAVILECPFNTLLSTVSNRFDALGWPSFPGAHLLVLWGGVQHGFNGFSHNPADYARDVNCPALLLHGSDDTRVTRQQAEEVFRNLAGEKRFEVLEGVGHESYVQARPEQWRRFVADFLKEKTGR